MTDTQKQTIHNMRRNGAAHSQIADSLGLSVNTVKSYCRRNKINAKDASNDKINEDICKQCGKNLVKMPQSKAKIFCCDKCRFDWWNVNRIQMNRKGVHRLTCAQCGAEFGSYDKNRKYCGHACYINYRFGDKEVRHDKRAI